MGNPLWAPWRIEYILAPKGQADCIFCGIPRASEQEQRDRLVVATTRRAFVMLNRYPFASGHLLIVPHAHVASLDALEPADHEALFRLVRESTTRLRAALKCEGMNVGINLGTAAGAGIAEHLHVHIVPRWPGDTNFMPVLADARVVPQALEATRDHLLGFFADLPASVVDEGPHGRAARGEAL
ncbi:HIT family protein [Sorangium sp. KYC3313]|uniref:HIT family protein n=1 Tax=Sorangium sp. KYC3313 TaxID=3449740 RepID=UPI003F8A2D80